MGRRYRMRHLAVGMVCLTSIEQDTGHCLGLGVASSSKAPASYAFGYQFIVDAVQRWAGRRNSKTASARIEGTSRAVGRVSRTFKLKLSPAGVELLLDCHCRLGHLVNELLPFGNTLYCALVHLDRIDTRLIADDLKTLRESGLLGERVCFVGAPLTLTDVTSRIAERLGPEAQRRGPAALNSRLFIVALKQFRLAPSEAIVAAYDAMLEEAGDCLKIGRMLRTRRMELGPIGQ